MFRHNFHTHTHYCDGTDAPEVYIREALRCGLESIGFSSHAPVPMENNFAIGGEDRLWQYCREINKLKDTIREIDIFLGLEADYIPGISLDFSYLRNTYGLDYIIGSVHLVKSPEGKLWFIDGPDRALWTDGLRDEFKGDIRNAVKAYYDQVSEMVSTQQPDVVGHIDKVKMHNRGKYFSEDEPWYRMLVADTIRVVKEAGCIVEVNTRGLYKKRSNALFPGLDVLHGMYLAGIPLTISSDAHHPSELILMLDNAMQAVREAGYKEVYIFSEGGWRGIPLC